jgi:hypothetical protein
MCEFTCQALNGKDKEYLEAHPVTAQVFVDTEKVVTHVEGGRVVKYDTSPSCARREVRR